MSREKLLENTLDKLSKLSKEKLQEVSDFTESLLSKLEEKSITQGIEKLVSDSKSFNFLEDEEDLYTSEDLKEVFK